MYKIGFANINFHKKFAAKTSSHRNKITSFLLGVYIYSVKISTRENGGFNNEKTILRGNCPFHFLKHERLDKGADNLCIKGREPRVR